jgi:hypothetical protein
VAKFSREDERDGEPRQDTGGGGNTNILVVVLVLAGALVVACGGGLVAFRFLAVRAEREQAEAARDAFVARVEAEQVKAEVARPTTARTRDEWRTLLVGKTMDEVLKEAGKPDRTDDDGDWVYYSRSVDPVSGNLDQTMWVIFDKLGRVERVKF